MRSYTLVHFLPGDFQDAETENLQAADLSEGVFKTVGQSSPVSAVLTSAPLKALFPFNQLLLTANAALGPGDELACQAQVQIDAGWSPWFDFGSFNPAGGAASVRDQENPFGRMGIDTIMLKSRAQRLRYRIKLLVRAGSAPRALRLVSAVYTDTSLPYDEAAAVKKTAGFKALKLAVPQYSQMLEQVNYSRDICSPTALAMALNYFGLKSSPLGTAALVLDNTEAIYGNWSFNTRCAGAKGLYAWLTRLNSMDEAQRHLCAGILLIASLTFGPDELKNSPLKRTAGHLMVIKGFNAGGNVIVNDPAAPDQKTVERVYDRKEFARAWFKNKYGTAYAVTPAIKDFLTVRPPFAEMFSRPVNFEKDDREKLIETQVLPGERIRLIEAGGGWLKIEALEQPHKKSPDAKAFTPYPGWIEAKNAVFSLPDEPGAVVKEKKAGLEEAAAGELSMGVKIKLLGREKDSGLRALLPGGESGVVSEKDVNYLPVKPAGDGLRKKILETARKFLGDKYYWGGRSGFGIDCSGLAGLVYRAWGLNLPRNASDQFAASKSAARESLKPADLVFSSEADNPENISHVMLYSGEGKIIEATRDTDSVREVSFKEKFGLELNKVKNGQIINGKKIYFRRIIR
ncbi:MAG: C39 family peptidase [Elusimicrobia bacterium]|nr:C39 family peptidase [Elusimicrobiota bacterium]